MQKKSQVKTAKGRKLSSTQWLLRHLNDPFVKEAKSHGYLSRAAFKLLEIDSKFKIISKSSKVGGVFLDLGAAPGSWLQVLVEKTLSKEVKIFGLDLKKISFSHDKITRIEGDFTQSSVVENLKELTNQGEITLILSDMAPNSCGDKKTDHIRIVSLAQEVLFFIENYQAKGGNAAIKLLQGAFSQSLNALAKKLFNAVHWYKPKASYSDSTELYLILLDKKENPCQMKENKV
jgi:23S rRNA (uridine2552-2'-O)-methyltransferase